MVKGVVTAQRSESRNARLLSEMLGRAIVPHVLSRALLVPGLSLDAWRVPDSGDLRDNRGDKIPIMTD